MNKYVRKRQMFRKTLLAIALGVSTSGAFAADWNIQEGLGKEKFLTLWNDSSLKLDRGVFVWVYDSRNEPAVFNGQGWKVVQKAMEDWERVCGIRFIKRDGLMRGFQMDGISSISWQEMDMSLGGYTSSWTKKGFIAESDIGLNPQTNLSVYQLQTLARHEIGHAIGLAHSDLEGSTMSGPPFSHYGFPDQLQPDDIKGCQEMYGAAGESPPIKERIEK